MKGWYISPFHFRDKLILDFFFFFWFILVHLRKTIENEVCYLYIVVGHPNTIPSHINIQSITLSRYMCTSIFTHTHINILCPILCLYIVCSKNISHWELYFEIRISLGWRKRNECWEMLILIIYIFNKTIYFFCENIFCIRQLDDALIQFLYFIVDIFKGIFCNEVII